MLVTMLMIDEILAPTMFASLSTTYPNIPLRNDITSNFSLSVTSTRDLMVGDKIVP